MNETLTKTQRDALRDYCDPEGFPLHNAKLTIIRLLDALDVADRHLDEANDDFTDLLGECKELKRERDAMQRALRGNCLACACIPDTRNQTIIECKGRSAPFAPGNPCLFWTFAIDRFTPPAPNAEEVLEVEGE